MIATARFLVCIAFFFSFTPSKAKESGVGLSCQVIRINDVQYADLVCSELLKELRQIYPEYSFIIKYPNPKLRLTVLIHLATKSGLSLQMIWTDKAGQKTEGERQSISISDKELTASLRASLYRRILAATPMPKSF